MEIVIVVIVFAALFMAGILVWRSGLYSRCARIVSSGGAEEEEANEVRAFDYSVDPPPPPSSCDGSDAVVLFNEKPNQARSRRDGGRKLLWVGQSVYHIPSGETAHVIEVHYQELPPTYTVKLSSGWETHADGEDLDPSKEATGTRRMGQKREGTNERAEGGYDERRNHNGRETESGRVNMFEEEEGDAALKRNEAFAWLYTAESYVLNSDGAPKSDGAEDEEEEMHVIEKLTIDELNECMERIQAQIETAETMDTLLRAKARLRMVEEQLARQSRGNILPPMGGLPRGGTFNPSPFVPTSSGKDMLSLSDSRNDGLNTWNRHNNGQVATNNLVKGTPLSSSTSQKEIFPQRRDLSRTQGGDTVSHALGQSWMDGDPSQSEGLPVLNINASYTADGDHDDDNKRDQEIDTIIL